MPEFFLEGSVSRQKTFLFIEVGCICEPIFLLIPAKQSEEGATSMLRYAIFALLPTGFGKSTVAYCGVTGSDAKLKSLLGPIKSLKLLLPV